MSRFGDHNYDGHEILPTESLKKLTAPVADAGYTIPQSLGSIEYYVWRLMKSAAKRPALDIHFWEHPDKPSVHLFVAKKRLMAMLFLRCTEPQREQVVRRIFAKAGAVALQDDVSGEPGNESRFLLYSLATTASVAAGVIAEFFRKGYDLAENTRLEFNFRERESV